MAGKVQVIVDIESESVEFATEKTLTLTEKMRLLKKELQTIPEGTKQWHVLNNTFNDTKDALDRVNTKSKDIFGTMSLLPGPIGQVSNSLEQTIDAFKIFGSLKTTDIKAQLANLLTDFKDIAKSIGNLTGLTKVYTTLNNALASSFVKVGVGETAAAAGARAFSAALVATGVGALIVALGLAVNALMEMANAESDAEIATRELNNELERQNTLLDLNAKDAARRRRVTIAEMKAQGKTESEIRKYQIDQAYADYTAAYDAEVEARNTYNANIGKVDEKGLADLESNLDKRIQATKDTYTTYLETGYNARAEENRAIEADNQKKAQKAEQQREKNKQEREKELEELRKGNKEALEETRNARVNETNEVNEKYDHLVVLARKYGQSTTDLEKGRTAALAKIAEKYNKEDAENLEKAQEERLEAIKKYLDKEEKLRELKSQEAAAKRNQKLRKDLYSGLITEQEFEQKSLDSNLEFAQKQQAQDEENYNKRKATLVVSRAFGLISQKQYEEELAANQMAFDEKNLANQNAVADATLAIEERNYEVKKYWGEQNIQMQQALIDAEAAIRLSILDAISTVFSALKMVAGKNKGLAKSLVILEQGAAIGRILVDTSASLAKIAFNTAIIPPIIPPGIPNPAYPAAIALGAKNAIAVKIGAGIGIANAVIGAAKGIAEIDKADTGEGASSPAASGEKAVGSKFAKGGLLKGRSHQEGGILTPFGELEGGEFVINKNSTQSFLPILTAINAIGNQTNESSNTVSAIQNMLSAQQSPIIKTYVVASEMSSQQEANKKLQDLAKI